MLLGSCRYGVYTKSPQTGFYSESYAGGKAPEAMDEAGFDAIIIKGQSGSPLALCITPEGAQFHDASELWGMDTHEAEKQALKRFAVSKPGYYKPGALVIGPAGEKQIGRAHV